jgi:hypothetical protein
MKAVISALLQVPGLRIRANHDDQLVACHPGCVTLSPEIVAGDLVGRGPRSQALNCQSGSLNDATGPGEVLRGWAPLPGTAATVG